VFRMVLHEIGTEARDNIADDFMRAVTDYNLELFDDVTIIRPDTCSRRGG
jgi:hypothetical protein